MRQTRALIEIDEELCDGCGLCVPSCEEGAIQVIDGKARLISESRCDGLGVCLGHCPRGALKVTQRPAEPFVDPMTAPDAATEPMGHRIAAMPHPELHGAHGGGGCPGSRMRILNRAEPAAANPGASQTVAAAGAHETSRLSHWPVQIGLIPPHAPFLDDANLVVAADCVPVALPGFHREFVDGNAVMIGCPKFDDLESYARRFAAIFSTARVRSVTVVVMEVPCCRALPTAVLRGMQAAHAVLPIEVVVVGVDGAILQRGAVHPEGTPGS